MQYLTTTNVAIAVACVAIFNYLYPLLRPLWIVPSTALWGYHVGKRHRKALERLHKPISHNPTGGTISPEEYEKILLRFSKELQNQYDAEVKHLLQINSDKMNDLSTKTDNIITKLAAVRNRISQRVHSSKSQFLGKIITSLGASFNQRTGRDLFLFLTAAVIVFLDALIAMDIIESLGLVTKPLPLLGQHGLPLLLGSFITIGVAISLHIIMGPELGDKLVKDPAARKIASLLVLSAFFVLLILMVLFPSAAKPIFETVLRMAWALGVIAVYWLFGQIVGESNDFFRIFVAALMFAIPLLYVLFGIGYVIQLLMGFLWDAIVQLFLQLRKTHTTKQRQNMQLSETQFRKGLNHGRRP